MSTIMKSHQGLVRKNNEDAAWFDENAGLFAVADGMGGHLAGEVASGMAIDGVRSLLDMTPVPDMQQIRSAFFHINRRIAQTSAQDEACRGMGTTLSLLWCAQRYAYIAHIGDSRIYRYRRAEELFQQITADHSLVEEMVRQGLITKEEARVHPRRNIITRALGTEGEAAPDLFTAETRPGDIWLLCSDGLTTMVEDDTLHEVLRAYPLSSAAEVLMQLALERGGIDNITFILHEEEASPWNRG